MSSRRHEEVCLSLLVSNECETLSLSCLFVLVLALLNAESKEDKLQLSGPVRHRGGEEFNIETTTWSTAYQLPSWT